MTSNLIISVPGEESVLFELNADRIGLGRSPENQIHLDVKEVSSSHLEIEKQGDDFVVTDLDSFNGTRVNGKKITEPTPLKDQDRILIGETVPAHFLLLAEGADPEDAVVKAGEDGQKAAAAYVSLDEKVRQLEETISSLKADIGSLEESGDDPEKLKEMQDDLIKKTQRVETLKTAQTATAPPAAAAAPAAPAVPTPVANPGAGGPPMAPPVKKVGIPLKPPGVPPAAAPKKPPGVPPVAAPKKPPSGG